MGTPPAQAPTGRQTLPAPIHLLSLSLLRSSARGVPHQQGFRPFRTSPPACSLSSLRDFGGTTANLIEIFCILDEFCKYFKPELKKNWLTPQTSGVATVHAVFLSRVAITLRTNINFFVFFLEKFGGKCKTQYICNRKVYRVSRAEVSASLSAGASGRTGRSVFPHAERARTYIIL